MSRQRKVSSALRGRGDAGYLFRSSPSSSKGVGRSRSRPLPSRRGRERPASTFTRITRITVSGGFRWSHRGTLAASIAGVVAQAGDIRLIVTGSQMMIHETLGIGMRDAEHMREYANVLDKQAHNIAGIYAERSSRSADSSHSCAASVPQTTPNDARGTRNTVRHDGKTGYAISSTGVFGCFPWSDSCSAGRTRTSNQWINSPTSPNVALTPGHETP